MGRALRRGAVALNRCQASRLTHVRTEVRRTVLSVWRQCEFIDDAESCATVRRTGRWLDMYFIHGRI